MAKQHLMSKRASILNGERLVIDDLHDMTSNGTSMNEGFIDEIIKKSKTVRNPFSFVFNQDGNNYVGHRGLVGDVLGWEHEFAYEQEMDAARNMKKGRRIPFRHAYRLNPEETIPEANELSSRLKSDLESLLRRAHAGEENIVSEVTFSTPRQSGTAWDKVAHAFESGAQDGHISFFDGGKHLGTIDVEKKTSGKWVGKVLQDRRALLGAGIAAAAVVGTGLYFATRDGDQSGPER